MTTDNSERIKACRDAIGALYGRYATGLLEVLAEHFGESAPEQKEAIEDLWSFGHNVEVALKEPPSVIKARVYAEEMMKILDRLMDGQPVAPSVDTNAERCKHAVRGLMGPNSDICGNLLPCPDHPADAPQEPTCAYEYLTASGVVFKICGEIEEVHTHGHDFVNRVATAQQAKAAAVSESTPRFVEAPADAESAAVGSTTPDVARESGNSTVKSSVLPSKSEPKETRSGERREDRES